jgi:hypothetical protein
MDLCELDKAINNEDICNKEMGTGELAQDYKKFGCTNKLFWPSIISICKQYTN